MDNVEERLNLPFTGLISFLRTKQCLNLAELDADIAVLGAPTDEGSPWVPGARFGPRTIREMSVRGMNWGMSPAQDRYGYFDLQEDRHYLEREFRYSRIADCGDVDVLFTNVEQTFANITRDVKAILRAGALPIVIGGDHAITFPIVRAYDETRAEKVHVIHFDAHLDYWPFQHGVLYSNGTPIRLVADLPFVGHIVQVGIRSLRHRRQDLEDSVRRGNDVVTVNQTRERGVDSVLEHLDPGAQVYVSIDIDVLDMPLVPGCSSSEVGGFDYPEFKEVLAFIAERFHVVGFDLVEVNPLLDIPSRSTSLIAAQLIQEFLARIVENPSWKRAHGVTTEVPGAGGEMS
jgi:agmatinase